MLEINCDNQRSRQYTIIQWDHAACPSVHQVTDSECIMINDLWTDHHWTCTLIVGQHHPHDKHIRHRLPGLYNCIALSWYHQSSSFISNVEHRKCNDSQQIWLECLCVVYDGVRISLPVDMSYHSLVASLTMDNHTHKSHAICQLPSCLPSWFPIITMFQGFLSHRVTV